MQKRRFVRDDRENYVAQTRDTALHDGACAQLLKFPSEMAACVVLRVRVPARQLGVCETSCQPPDECEGVCRRGSVALSLAIRVGKSTASGIARAAEPRVHRWTQKHFRFHLFFANVCRASLKGRAQPHTKPLHHAAQPPGRPCRSERDACATRPRVAAQRSARTAALTIREAGREGCGEGRRAGGETGLVEHRVEIKFRAPHAIDATCFRSCICSMAW